MKILIVDDQRSARRILAGIVAALPGVEVVEAGSLDEARRALEGDGIDVALIDIRLGPDLRNRDGLILVQEVRQRSQAVPVVVTVSNEMPEIRAAMRQGAFDYILKDELCEELVLPILREIQSRRSLEREVLSLRARVGGDAVPGMVGASPAMQKLRSLIARVALSNRPALISGPTGSGKELVVRGLHALGPRPEEPLLDINCGAIPEALMESQLFGHERGSFTGADRKQEGYFNAVRKGTLFLDEIAELPLPLQAKLLRVLETGRFRAVGSTAEQQFEGRVIAATHANLAERVKQGRFREDLLYRLNVLELQVPGLAERREDVPALVAHFVSQQHRALSFTQEAMNLLASIEWPGNVRQLRNLVDRIAVFADSEVVTPEVILSLGAQSSAPGGAKDGAPSVEELARQLLRMPCANKLEAIEAALLHEAMALTEGNKSGAARLLGVHRKAVERRLDRRDEPEEQDAQ